jgi:ArsR family metal-binding transcriptional regulator
MNSNDLADDVKNISNAIEALEWVQKASPLLIQQAKEIERLIGAEPITYGMLTFCKNCGEQNPYYIAPKPLTDEEILEELFIPKHEWESYKAQVCLKQIRAILKKASEK